MAEVSQTPLAKSDLLEIAEFIAQRNSQAAFDLLDEFEAKFDILAKQPQVGSLCMGLASDLPDDLRRFPVKQYVIFYRPTNEGIVVYRVLHGRRDIPKVLEETQDE